MADTSTKKKQLRTETLAKRAQLSPEEHRRLSAAIVAKLMADERIKAAQIILSYQTFGSEADITAFNEWALSQGITLAFPRCHDAGRMEAAVATHPAALRAGRYGIIEPSPEHSHMLTPEELEIILIPCVGFSATNIRLGMGGGFYDRYLPHCVRALKLGIAFSLQKIPEKFAEPWDTTLDGMVTE
jgi:5-formyltetrahydrofolate cyclo-ligase